MLSLSCVAWLYKSAVANRSTIRDKDNEIRDKDNEIASLKIQLDECETRCPDSPTPQPTPGRNWISEHPVYKIYQKNTALTSDERFQKLLVLSSLSAEESRYADDLLKALPKASALWWQFVEKRYSYEEIRQFIEVTGGVQKTILDRWIADVMRADRYNVKLGNRRHPASYVGYDIRLTVRSSVDGIDHVRKYRLSEDRVLVPLDKNQADKVSVVWKRAFTDDLVRYWTYYGLSGTILGLTRHPVSWLYST